MTFVSHLKNILLYARDLACFCPCRMDYNSEFCNTQSCETMTTTKIGTSQFDQGTSFEFTNHSLVLYRACMFGSGLFQCLKMCFQTQLHMLHLTLEKYWFLICSTSRYVLSWMKSSLLWIRRTVARQICS